MTRKKKILITAAALAAVVAVGAAATHSIAHDRGGHGGWKMGHAGYSQGYKGGRMGGHMGGRMGQRIDTMFTEVDADKDGKITADEMTAYRAAKIAAADKNGDGSLQIDEFQGIWADLMRPRMVDHFQFLDGDGDGKVTDAEIAAPMTRMSRHMDRNDDGVIARDEMRPQKRGWHQRWRDNDDDDKDDDDKKKN